MNKNATLLLLILTGALIFNFVFWQEKWALNTVFFDVFIVVSLFVLYPGARQHAIVRWLLLGHFICLATLIIHNTAVSKIAFSVTLLMAAGFAEYLHRSVWYAGGSLLMNAVFFVAGFTEELSRTRGVRIKRRKIGKFVRFAFFPLALLAVFFVIYLLANSVFKDITARIGLQVEKLLSSFLGLFSWQRALFLLAGLYISGAILLRSRIYFFMKEEAAQSDDLPRIRKPLFKKMREPLYGLIVTVMGRFARGMLALKNENTTGILSLALLNALLLIINSIDISYLWAGFNYMGNVHLQQMLHEGAELLILSIVLAMMILLFFFKGNLNFYQRNKWLKYGAYAWILQNAILVISVFLRDYYYIVRYGLAYKRIGVLFFLLMVLIGLITVLVKIRYKKTNYFLFRVNAWAGIIVLVLSSTVHWDELIAGYNLQHRDRVPLDAFFLLTLSDKTLPLLDNNRNALWQQEQEWQKKNPADADNTGASPCDCCFIEQLQEREKKFLHEQEQLSWLSWNYSDDFTKRHLQKKKRFN